MAEKALSFLSKGWREVRESAGSDVHLMRAGASSFKSLADREPEDLLHSASVLSDPPWLLAVAASSLSSLAATGSSSISELEIVKQNRPNLLKIRRMYSLPEVVAFKVPK